MRNHVLLAAVLIAVVFLSPAGAGQFKRINASTLAPGQQTAVHASPLNQGNAMEMDTYEFLSGPPGSGNRSFRCRITANTSGRALRLRMIGVDGSILTSCTTPVNGTCNVAFGSLAPNLLFQCTVATGNGLPVVAGAHYVLAVQRASGAAAASAASDEDSEIADASGMAKSIR